MTVFIDVVEEKGSVRTVGGELNPPGSKFNLGMGYVEVRKTKKAGLHVVRFSGKGNYTYSLRIEPGNLYRIGASYGHMVKLPEKETDPLLRVLRELCLPTKLLKKMEEGESITVSAFYRDVHRFSHPASSWRWVTNGNRELVSSVIEKSYPNTHCSDDVHDELRLYGGSWAIQVTETAAMGGGVRRTVSSILVWPGCDALALKEGLFSTGVKFDEFVKN